MRKYFIFAVSILVLGGAQADETATKITGDELRNLVTGANVVHYNKVGSTRRWTDDPDGTFVASSNAKGTVGGVGNSASANGHGKWSINSDDKYCVQIDWKHLDEKWCAFIVKAADGSYYLNSVDSGRKIEFSR